MTASFQPFREDTLKNAIFGEALRPEAISQLQSSGFMVAICGIPNPKFLSFPCFQILITF